MRLKHRQWKLACHSDFKKGGRDLELQTGVINLQENGKMKLTSNNALPLQVHNSWGCKKLIFGVSSLSDQGPPSNRFLVCITGKEGKLYLLFLHTWYFWHLREAGQRGEPRRAPGQEVGLLSSLSQPSWNTGFPYHYRTVFFLTLHTSYWFTRKKLSYHIYSLPSRDPLTQFPEALTSPSPPQNWGRLRQKERYVKLNSF